MVATGANNLVHVHEPINTEPPYFRQRSHDPKDIVRFLKRSFEQSAANEDQLRALQLMSQIPRTAQKYGISLQTRTNQMKAAVIRVIVTRAAICFDRIFFCKALQNRVIFEQLPDNFQSRGRCAPRRQANPSWHQVAIRQRFWDQRNRQYYTLGEILNNMSHEICHAPFLLFSCAACFHSDDYEILGKGHGVLYLELASAIQTCFRNEPLFADMPLDLGFVRAVSRELQESFPNDAIGSERLNREALRWRCSNAELAAARSNRLEMLERRRVQHVMARARRMARQAAQEAQQPGTAVMSHRRGRRAANGHWWQRLSARDRAILRANDSRSDTRIW